MSGRDDSYANPGHTLVGIVFGTLAITLLDAALATPKTTAGGRSTMAAREETLPRNSGFQIVGRTRDELAYGLSLAQEALNPGKKVSIELVSSNMPSEQDLATFHVKAARLGYELDGFPSTRMVDGLASTTIILKMPTPSESGTAAFPLLALIPIIPTVLIIGLIAFGITRIGDISKALIPILLITIFGTVMLAGILTRRSVTEPAADLVRQRYLTRTIPVEKSGSEHQERIGGWQPSTESYSKKYAGKSASLDGRKARITSIEGGRAAAVVGPKDSGEASWFTVHEVMTKYGGNFRMSRGHLAIPDYTEYEADTKPNTAKDPEMVKIGLKNSVKEEYEAAETYRTRAMTALDLGDKETMELYHHIAGEEDVHMAEFQERLDNLAFLPDSPEFIAATIDKTGWRQKLDSEFQAAMQRCRK